MLLKNCQAFVNAFHIMLAVSISSDRAVNVRAVLCQISERGLKRASLAFIYFMGEDSNSGMDHSFIKEVQCVLPAAVIYYYNVFQSMIDMGIDPTEQTGEADEEEPDLPDDEDEDEEQGE